MDSQEVTKTEKPDFRRDFQESSANYKFILGNEVARGAGFEPARPKDHRLSRLRLHVCPFGRI